VHHSQEIGERGQGGEGRLGSAVIGQLEGADAAPAMHHTKDVQSVNCAPVLLISRHAG
jgi:hypothetical protein